MKPCVLHTEFYSLSQMFSVQRKKKKKSDTDTVSTSGFSTGANFHVSANTYCNFFSRLLGFTWIEPPFCSFFSAICESPSNTLQLCGLKTILQPRCCSRNHASVWPTGLFLMSICGIGKWLNYNKFHMVSNIAQLSKWYLSFSEKRKNDFFFSLKLEQNLCEQVSYKNIQWTPQLKYNRHIYAITLTVYVKCKR